MPMSRLPALITATVLLGACDGGPPAEPQPATTAPTTAAPSPPPRRPWQPSDDPRLAKFLGMSAPKPVTWLEHPPTTGLGRIANYTVPGRGDDAAAEIVVYHFGATLGGTPEANIERWESQFEPEADGTPAQAYVERLVVDGMPVRLVELAGEWMKMGTSWYTHDQLFLAAIVETPEGSVFIRFAGNTATVSANRDAFLNMIKNLRREPG